MDTVRSAGDTWELSMMNGAMESALGVDAVIGRQIDISEAKYYANEIKITSESSNLIDEIIINILILKNNIICNL